MAGSPQPFVGIGSILAPGSWRTSAYVTNQKPEGVSTATCLPLVYETCEHRCYQGCGFKGYPWKWWWVQHGVKLIGLRLIFKVPLHKAKLWYSQGRALGPVLVGGGRGWGGGGGGLWPPGHPATQPPSHLATQPPSHTQPPSRVVTILGWALHFCILPLCLCSEDHIKMMMSL